MPSDTAANDLWHWFVKVGSGDGRRGQPLAAGHVVSARAVVRDGEALLLTRDPDGHRALLTSAAAVTGGAARASKAHEPQRQ
jgi:hypothetical protein